ncbi:hypothetical protein N7456_011713 [Penicillium angulare]|uniref:Uncharacterized protein n=1 Tax=Penicillium angulare TaxID=116970 RepID=A0A9W9K0Y5_9EURO|nr:hypothetical protein N7456_011713 [Penicillium angulare]
MVRGDCCSCEEASPRLPALSDSPVINETSSDETSCHAVGGGAQQTRQHIIANYHRLQLSQSKPMDQ